MDKQRQIVGIITAETSRDRHEPLSFRERLEIFFSFVFWLALFITNILLLMRILA